MAKVTGLGGAFIKSDNPETLAAWYEKHLGISFGGNSYAVFPLADEHGKAATGYNIISFFKKNSDYFSPSSKDTMMNFRVDDLMALLEQLKNAGVEIAGEPLMEEYGKFGWIMDPEGNKIELWQPPEAG
jgi:predicted enzyme related to lactoylglutathione lyase